MAEDALDEVQDSTPAEEVELESSTEESTDVDVEALKAENTRLEKVARDQKGRADKAEIQLKKAKMPQTETNQISDEKYERLDLKTDGYKSEEVELIMELGGKKVIDNPVVKEAIANLRRKAKSQEATPAGTAKSPVFQKYSEQDLKRMPLSELEKIVPQD